MYRPLSYPSFGGGLNLRDKVDTVAPQFAIDAMNVEFNETGAVEQRKGYELFTAGTMDGQPDTIFSHRETGSANVYLLVGDIATGQVTALTQAGAEDATEASFSNGGCFGFTAYGAPNAERTYLGNGVDEIFRYDISNNFVNVPDDGGRAPPKGGALAVFPTSNRLCCARFTTATGGPNGGVTTPGTVWFSNAGDPETWSDDDYIHLEPGDGESIQDMVAWREFLFVFKETKFFVFTGQSTDSSGGAVFDYYKVDTGHGAVGCRVVTADENGVYFWDRQGGLMRTTGGEPEHLSELIRPIYEGLSSSYFTGGELDWSVADLIAVNSDHERVYINYSTGGTANDRTLVFDPHYNRWTLWDIPAADMVSHQTTKSVAPRLFFSHATSDEVYNMDIDLTSDIGVAISSRWRSGWTDWGSPEQKLIRQLKGWGRGTLRVGLSVDYQEPTAQETVVLTTSATPDTWGDGTDATDTWGDGSDDSDAWGPVAENSELAGKVIRPGSRLGTLISLQFTNLTLDQEWAMHRMDLHNATERPVSKV